MAYKKSVAGDNNQANETASHNRLIINTGAGFTVFAVWITLAVTACIVVVAIFFGEWLKWGIALTIGAMVISGWLWLVMWTRRSISHTSTALAVNKYRRDQAWLESRVAVREALYALFLDENDNLQFRDTKQVTENRHYPAIEAPKHEVDATEAILAMYDDGQPSAHEIHRWVNHQTRHLPKDKQPTYHQVLKVLNQYRDGWNTKHKKVIDAEEYPKDE